MKNKLKNYEIDALVNRVVEEIKEIKLKEVPEKFVQDFEKINNVIEQNDKKEQLLKKEISKLEEESSKLKDSFKKKYDVSTWNWDLDSLKTNYINIPNTSTIRSKIVLSSLFNSKEELQELINSIVKEFTNGKKA